MGWSGYGRALCKSGHYQSWDESYNFEPKPVKCHCGEPIVWSEIVDTTNDEGYPTELKKLSEKSCEHCGSHLETIYQIPKQRKKP